MDSEEDISARHRKERKDLTNTITSMKKQASKKTRKQVNAKCQELERELEERHQIELNAARGEDTVDIVEEISPEQLLSELSLEEKDEKRGDMKQDEHIISGKKRRNRQKERLAKREAEIERMRREAQDEADQQPDLKKIEQEALDKLCSVLRLKQVDIQPDGHCLFNSILDQLKLRHSAKVMEYNFPKGYDGKRDVKDMDVYSLRRLSCSYVRENKDDFIPYLFDETTFSIKDVDEYTNSMESTAQWGGDVELLALSKIFNCCISVLMCGRSTLKVNEEGSNEELKLVYYKHSYTLGEHYNSLHDM